MFTTSSSIDDLHEDDSSSESSSSSLAEGARGGEGWGVCEEGEATDMGHLCVVEVSENLGLDLREVRQ